MEPRDIQKWVLAAEVNALVPLGLEKTDQSDFPVLWNVVLPALRSRQDIDNLRQLLIAAANSLPEPSWRQAAKILLHLESTKELSRVGVRDVDAAKAMKKEPDAFRKSWRWKLMEGMGAFLASNHRWIDTWGVAAAGQGAISPETAALVATLRAGAEGAVTALAGARPQLRRNYRYKIDVILRAGQSSEIKTHYANTRELPQTEHYSVYICRTEQEMRKALLDPSLIGVELASLSIPEWKETWKQFGVSVAIGDAEPLEETGYMLLDKDGGVARHFRAPSLRSNTQSVQVATRYFASELVNNYPVKLASHFTADGAEIEFNVHSDGVTSFECSEYFAGFDGKDAVINLSVDRNHRPPKAGVNSMTLSVPKSVLLWPGSGAHFRWTVSADPGVETTNVGSRPAVTSSPRERAKTLIRPEGKLRCGMYDYPPFAFTEGRRPKSKGSWRDLADKVAESLGMTPEYTPMSVSELFEMPSELDIVCGMFDTTQRREHALFSIPFQQIGLQGVCRKELGGDIHEKLLQGELSAFVYCGEVGWEYATTEFGDAYRNGTILALTGGSQFALTTQLSNCDVVLMDAVTCVRFLQQPGMANQYRLAFDTPPMSYGVCFAVREDHEDWLPHINQALRSARNTDDYLAAERKALVGYEAVVSLRARIADFAKQDEQS